MEKMSHKARTRQRILDEAARIMREVGTEGIGVAALMKRAGLTHGGFYAHFSSREELVQAVLEQMFADSAQRTDAAITATDPAEQLSQFIDLYLSEEHRNHPAEGCPLPALMSEAAHLPVETRTRFTAGMEAVRKRLATPLRKLGYAQADDLAMTMLAEMSGALALARACPDDARASQMLAVSRQALKARAGLESEAA
ncbi:TetR/AcrR family transcriptional regulator [[Erwinia] mediterraneensis]|uniref:TetR/AcrR family transcriptional regulator n=1 Tax=[Erwinia] mediterraneensis TaxID=2161819 RepID=UPI0010326EDF|nr:TetR/AcrR family transcriptional regulator [[Erwinia] mediterraneensis]